MSLCTVPVWVSSTNSPQSVHFLPPTPTPITTADGKKRQNIADKCIMNIKIRSADIWDVCCRSMGVQRLDQGESKQPAAKQGPTKSHYRFKHHPGLWNNAFIEGFVGEPELTRATHCTTLCSPLVLWGFCCNCNTRSPHNSPESRGGGERLDIWQKPSEPPSDS